MLIIVARASSYSMTRYAEFIIITRKTSIKIIELFSINQVENLTKVFFIFLFMCIIHTCA